MLIYKIASLNPVSHYLDIEAYFDFTSFSGDVELILPAWRPGRYEGADYPKNVRQFEIKDSNGQKIPYRKIARNVWSVNPQGNKICVAYSYFAFQADAGASYIDDEIWLINFINCLIYPEGFEHKECSVSVSLPTGWTAATTLKGSSDNFYSAENYSELTDRPLLGSKHLDHLEYEVSGVPFHIYTAGQPPVDLDTLIPAFKAFSEEQLNTFKSCPFDKYYFLTLVLPFRFYHGVEHADNTVLVLGIDPGTEKQKFIDDLLGVASHELFHTWNIKKIRPRELLPYNFRTFTIFNTGMIAEGFTTYYGDLFLVRSGVWSISRYIDEMNMFIKRHYRNPGRYYASLTTSSENLWIDGYKQGAPYHKVSIYIKGSIVSMMLDMKIRILSGYEKSLDDLIRWMDRESATEGYSLDDIKAQSEALAGEDLTAFFENYAYGTTPVDEELTELCSHFGLNVIKHESENPLERDYAFATTLKEDILQVEMTDKGSPAEAVLATGDLILLINDKKPVDYFNAENIHNQTLVLEVKRLGKMKEVHLNKGDRSFFSYYQLKIEEDAGAKKLNALHQWLLNNKSGKMGSE